MTEPLTPMIPPQFDEATRRERLAFLNFEERDGVLLHELEGLFREHLPEITERFYRHLLNFEGTRRVLRDEAMIERLKAAQGAYLLESVRGPWDADYFNRRWRIGWVHNELHLEPSWFIGAFRLYRRILVPMIGEAWRGDLTAALEHIEALDKVMNLDLQLGLQSYYVHYEDTMARLREANTQIRAASAAKSQFLANMSHEFRTPLNAIIGFTEVMLDQLAGPLNAEQKEYLGDIHHAGQQLARLISDVLDLAKVEAGRLELFSERFAIVSTIREVITTMRPAADQKRLTLELVVPPDLGAISADQTRFKQILYNLLSNAVKFTQAGGVTVRAALEDGGLHVAVSDTGIGVRPDDLKTLFVAFSQVDASHARRYEGTGLGLALSRRLAEAHGGRIWVESVFGQGSTFHVWLPFQAAGRER